jgi:predicted Zn-dependent protease
MIHDTPLSNRGLGRCVIMALGVVAALGLGGCGSSGTKTVASASSAPVSAPTEEEGNWAGRDGVKDAIALLNEGNSKEARERLMAVLRKQPGDAIARQLVQQIDSDPKVLLGSESYSYTLKDGESLSSVAQRTLGNPMMFYALARYNGIAVPTSVEAGQTILVPGKRPEPARAAAKKTAPKAAPEPKAAAKPVESVAKPAARAANPAQASKFRGQALAALNSGAIDRAVSLLRQALSHDPGNGTIKGDLNRALRIQKTVRSRP